MALSELDEIASIISGQKFLKKQISHWLYQKHCRDITAMSNISKDIRARLAENFEIAVLRPLQRKQAQDQTSKYLFAVSNGAIESAVIPDDDRTTLCLSTQVGCKRACAFCCTGKQGFQGNLTVSEILGQYEGIIERDQITNIVYMGMGEPLDNLDAVLASLQIFSADWGYGKSASRITVSTIGILPNLETFLQKTNCPLAISLHSPFDEQRHELLPGTRHYNLQDLFSLLRAFYRKDSRRITFEYIIMEGVNHSLQHVKKLAQLLNGLGCLVNLIPYHTFTESQFTSPNLETVKQFQQLLEQKGITTTIRRSRGQEIAAACGLLSTQHNQSVINNNLGS